MPQVILQVVQETGFPMHQMSPPCTSGTHFYSSSEQMGSLYVCFLSSVCLAAAPATTPASYKMLDLSRGGEVMDTSMAKALCFSTSLESVILQVFFHDPNQHQLPVLGSRELENLIQLWRATTSPPNLQVAAWCASTALSGQYAHTPTSTTFCWEPCRIKGTTCSHDEACFQPELCCERLRAKHSVIQLVNQ